MQDGFEYDFSPTDVGVARAMTSYFTVDERLPLLLVHGLLHLIGYDHETMRDWKIMTQKEEEILNILKQFKDQLYCSLESIYPFQK